MGRLRADGERLGVADPQPHARSGRELDHLEVESGVDPEIELRKARPGCQPATGGIVVAAEGDAHAGVEEPHAKLRCSSHPPQAGGGEPRRGEALNREVAIAEGDPADGEISGGLHDRRVGHAVGVRPARRRGRADRHRQRQLEDGQLRGAGEPADAGGGHDRVGQAADVGVELLRVGCHRAGRDRHPQFGHCSASDEEPRSGRPGESHGPVAVLARERGGAGGHELRTGAGARRPRERHAAAGSEGVRGRRERRCHLHHERRDRLILDDQAGGLVAAEDDLGGGELRGRHRGGAGDRERLRGKVFADRQAGHASRNERREGEATHGKRLADGHREGGDRGDARRQAADANKRQAARLRQCGLDLALARRREGGKSRHAVGTAGRAGDLQAAGAERKPVDRERAFDHGHVARLDPPGRDHEARGSRKGGRAAHCVRGDTPQLHGE